jgi:hypothetical protein
MEALASFDKDRQVLMQARIDRRTERARKKERIDFLDPSTMIGTTQIGVEDARGGNFVGSEIPADLRRQWIQGTGPGAKPNASLEKSIRNVAYALLSGADGWMFDGEDALGQVSTMSLDNQRNLKLAIHSDPIFLAAAEEVAAEMNDWAKGFFGRTIIDDWQAQLKFTTYNSPTETVFRHPSSIRRFMLSTITERFAMPVRPSCCTCPRYRPPRKRRCGMISSPHSRHTSACPTGRLRSMYSSSNSKRAFN